MITYVDMSKKAPPKIDFAREELLFIHGGGWHGVG